MNKVIMLLLLSSIGSVAENIALDHNESEKIRKNLITILEKVKKFKAQKNSQINKLKIKLKLTQDEFEKYQVQKEAEIKHLDKKLTQTKRELSKSKQALKARIDIDERIEVTMIEPLDQLPEIKDRVDDIVTENSIDTPWVEIVIEDDTNIYELAQKYYGDTNEYRQIYVANKSRIGNELYLNEGMPLKIPVTEDFEDQPMVLNMD